MRIIGGRMRGLALQSVGKGDAAAHLRPTTDRVRESLFNLLQGGRFDDPVADAQVLDLFAGTGALGFEAISRGAAHATFVENGRAAGKILAANIAKTKTQAETRTIHHDATRLARADQAPATLVFLDPPYGKSAGQAALAAAANGGWIAPRGLIVWEDSTEHHAPPDFEKSDARRYGDTWLTLLRYIPDDK